MPTKITLPSFLKSKLEDSPHDAAVRKALKDFGNWFGDDSKQTFFPDYTNHGIRHIEQVLATATNLIPKKARPYFSGADAAALVLAVLLHDSALHLSKAGFYYLIKGSAAGAAPYVPVPFFDQDDWGKAWSDFMFLAKRWDDTMLLNVFGPDESTGSPRGQVRDPFDHWANLSETDGLLIGEFIRKHHPRLAHEMALHGVPGKDGIYLKLSDDLPLPWQDLVGLVARSHGLPLRTSLDYLRETPHFGSNGQRGYQNVHAVYLMALLRVADYVQIQGDRTSEKIFSFKDVPSLVSRVEHKVHRADVLISADDEDPESLQIDAHPKEVAIFLRLKEWLAGIQQELDGSWAVLGEVYGRYKELRKLGLAFRRVRSNLDNVAEFAKTVPYVPDRIRFDVARAELLKLLIGPLYGDDPSYGVRELMQNAIDAVREYDQFVLDNPQYASVPRREQEADVVVELGPLDEATGYATMTISDRGIGMTEATIRDYFLRAGASYRQSLQWKTNFEVNVEERNKSKIPRSGRFGVGALAAFLIGDEIEVETHHIADVEGYSFTAKLTSDLLEVQRKENSLFGTTIKIKLNKEVYAELIKNSDRVSRPGFCDWYCFDAPSVIRKFYDANNILISLNRRYKIDLEDTSSIWRKLDCAMPYDVYWNFEEGPTLTCNGLFVNNTRRLDRQFRTRFSRKSGLALEFLRYPNICVIDKDAQFPLNLRRDDLRVEDYPFADELAKDFLSEMLAWLLFNGPASIDNLSVIDVSFHQWLTQGYKGLLIANSKGFGIKLSVLLEGFLVRHVVLYQPGAHLSFPSPDTLISRGGNTSVNDEGANLSTVFFQMRIDESWVHRRRMFFSRNFLKNDAPKKFGFNVYTLGAESSKFVEEDYLEKQDGGWILASSATETRPETEVIVVDKPKKVLRDKAVKYEIKDYNIFEEYHFPEGAHVESISEPWLLDELWLEYFGREWIPYDLKERIAKFPDTAKFFAERYPQVVPDEAWALLGGKPAPA